jgi:proteic killer suppression protein
VTYDVLIEKDAKKGLINAPENVQNKFYKWVELVVSLGLPEVRKVPGFHDEPLKGKRQGQRSIRLNKSWRAIYRATTAGKITLILVEEVSKHEY